MTRQQIAGFFAKLRFSYFCAVARVSSSKNSTTRRLERFESRKNSYRCFHTSWSARCRYPVFTWENPYLCILRLGMQPARNISIFRTRLHPSRRSKLQISNDISDLLGILTSRLEWSEARISGGIPLRHTVAIGDSLPHLSQSIGLDILIRVTWI